MKIILFFCVALFLSLSVAAQNIKAYFNQLVDNTVSPITDAQTSSHLEDTICALINSSNVTLDIAVWDNGSTAIVTALNNAYGRGVQVRYISSTNSINSALPGLNANIPVLLRTSTLTSNVMHNKFVIADNAVLLTGSMNFGTGSMVDDYNNVIIISDVSLAQNYTTEFNEMWGSSGALPNTSNSKFGPDKTDNTIHNFTINGSSVQSYFSPTDNTTAQIVNAINSADFTLDIAIFTFTNNDIGDAVIAAKNRGVVVRCILENQSYIGSEYNNLINAGIPVISHQSIAYDFHHKYCIIDAMSPASDPVVVTGSHNWTNSAEQEYDENTLIIHNEIIANQYTEEFEKRFDELGGNGIQETGSEPTLQVFPNPCNTHIQISVSEKANIRITNLIGETVWEGAIQQKETIDVSFLNEGIYFVSNSASGQTLRLIKQ